jgi:hypothetical protein
MKQIAFLAASVLVLTGLAPRSRGYAQTAAPIWPIKAGANGRHLVDASDRPFLYFATTPWMIGVNATREEARLYLDDRKAAGVNTVQVIAVPWEDNPSKGWWVSTGVNRDNERPFTNESDFASFRDSYFSTIEYVVDQAKLRDMQVALAPMWPGCCDEGWVDEMRANSVDKFRAYGRYLGQKFGPKDNLMWIIGGDRNAETVDLPRYEALVAGIRENDTRHMMTFHPGSDADTRHIDQSWRTLDGVYTYGPEFAGSAGTNTVKHIYVKTHEAYNRTAVQPIILLEAFYEREHGSPTSRIRRQPYWSVLAGSTGFAYGNNYWNMRQTPDNWQAHLHDPGFDDFAIAAQFFRRYRWWELVPDQSRTWVTAGYGTYQVDLNDATGSNDYVTTAATNDKRLMIAYIPAAGNLTASRTLTVNTDQFSSAQLKSEWVNPVNGNSTGANMFARGGGRQFASPGGNTEANDWVLVISAVDLGTATPAPTAPPQPTPTPAPPTQTPRPQPTSTSGPVASPTALPAGFRTYYLPVVATE